MIEVVNISKRFGATQALDNVSFKVEKGKLAGFLGANGAGKTTTMDIICGCIGADSGTASVAGYDVFTEPLKVKSNIGYLPDEPPLYMDMLVRDYITFSARLHKLTGNILTKSVDTALEKLMLGDVAHRMVGNLSKGYKQRVGLAQAIVHNPDVLILDEPTEGLDPNQIIEIRELMKSLAGEHTVILSSHILSEIQNICDQVIIIDKGRVVESGSYEEIIASVNKTQSYRLKVANDERILIGAIAEIEGIATSEWSEAEGEIKFSLVENTDDSVLDEVTKKVVQGGHGLRELVGEKHGLEDVFYNITHNTEGRI